MPLDSSIRQRPPADAPRLILGSPGIQQLSTSQPASVQSDRVYQSPYFVFGPCDMNIEFKSPLDQKPGIIASLLGEAYEDLVKNSPSLWVPEQSNWKQYDRDVFSQPSSVGACIFLTWLDGHIVGFASWDPRQRPDFGIIGHNCVRPKFRDKGLGKRQIQEILQRFLEMGIKTAKVSTNDHSFFVPAQHMYTACGFQEINRIPWDRDPRQSIIEYEKQVAVPG